MATGKNEGDSASHPSADRAHCGIRVNLGAILPCFNVSPVCLYDDSSAGKGSKPFKLPLKSRPTLANASHEVIERFSLYRNVGFQASNRIVAGLERCPFHRQWVQAPGSLLAIIAEYRQIFWLEFHLRGIEPQTTQGAQSQTLSRFLTKSILPLTRKQNASESKFGAA